MTAPDVGTRLVRSMRFTQDDFDLFARLSGDDNPIHVDPEFSARTRFGRTVAHGMFLYSRLCGLMSELVPGSIQTRQQLQFPAPTYADDDVEVAIEVLAVHGPEVTVTMEMTDSSGTITCIGDALLMEAAT